MAKRQPTKPIVIPRDNAALIASALEQAGIVEAAPTEQLAQARRTFLARLRAYGAGDREVFPGQGHEEAIKVYLTPDSWQIAAALLGEPTIKLSQNQHHLKDAPYPFHLHDVYDDGVTIGYLESNGYSAQWKRHWYAKLILPDELLARAPADLTPPTGYVARAMPTRRDALEKLVEAYKPFKRFAEGSGR